MTRMTRNCCLLGLALLVFTSTLLEAADPRLSLIRPRGGQRGSEVELLFSGNRLEDAEQVFFYTPGFEQVSIEPVNANSFKAKIKIAPDTKLGEHVMAVRTKSGISDYRTFWVGPFPSTEEKEPNTVFERPQELELTNQTVEGRIDNEDVDYFRVNAKKGQRISVEVEGLRLGNTLFDPYCAILDKDRFELAAADDSPLLHQDCMASILAPEDGQYIIEIRDSAYRGNGASYYRAHIGTFPRPTAVYPAGGQLGQEVEVTYVGLPGGELKSKVKLPAEMDDDFGVLAEDEGGLSASPNTFRLFEHGNVLEVEPNENRNEATTATLPNAFNGVIQSEGDVDFFKFTAKKGETYEIHCHARSIRSPLDPVMNLYDANGKGLTGNDDANRSPDSYFRYRFPADGEYSIRVADHLSRGGADFVYRIEFTPVTPSIELGIPRVTRYGQERQTIYVPRGNRIATRMTIRRQNFGGDVVLNGEGLPEGMTMEALPVPSNMSTWPVLFEAAADAPLGGKLLDFTCKPADEKQDVTGHFANFADFVRYRNAQILWGRPVDQLAFAVIEESPYSLEIVQPKVPIVQNGSMNLKIVAHRKEGFTKAIRVEFPFRPPGIGTRSYINIPEGKNEVIYSLNANSNAAVGKWPVFALGLADGGNGTVMVSSQLATLEIAPPYVQVAMERAATEQGKPADIICKVTTNTPFEGDASVKLVGLPHKVEASEKQLNKETQELIFNVTTDPESPVGKHKNIFCQLIVTQNGEPITHRLGSTQLQIDKPLPPPKDKPKTKPVAKKEEPKKPAAPKVLTPLEKLRLEAEKRKDATQK
ncbi:MAG: PPC domain-containing protein [Planctomycetaceae bacterium]|nr:PPC domain-containing protein [Planctomycetaceae bacterium]